jgi:copper homeostasis protein
VGRILLETIISSLDDALAAARGGADRFELCSALALGGLTPSLGTFQLIREETNIPVMFMIRPRQAGMAYSSDEIRVMERDAALALEAGAEGLVFGFLTPDGEVDTGECRRFLKHCSRTAAGRQWVFHRAYDVVRDPERALEQLVDLGFTRVLTSGRKRVAMEGLDEIRRTVQQAAGRIEVLPGGGIRPEQVVQLVRETGVDQVHLSLTEPRRDPSPSGNPEVYFGADLPEDDLTYKATSEDRVRLVRTTLDGE